MTQKYQLRTKNQIKPSQISIHKLAWDKSKTLNEVNPLVKEKRRASYCPPIVVKIEFFFFPLKNLLFFSFQIIQTTVIHTA